MALTSPLKLYKRKSTGSGSDKFDEVCLDASSFSVTWGGSTAAITDQFNRFLLSTDIASWAKAANKPSYTLDEVTDGSTRKLSNYLLLTGGKLTGSLEIVSNGSSWNEGVRIHPASNGWSGIVFCESSNSGASGTSANTWSIHNNEGTFGIYRNGSNISSVTTGFAFKSGEWILKNNSNNEVKFPTSAGTLALNGQSQPASDVYPWAKASTKPTYAISEISGWSTIGTVSASTTSIVTTVSASSSNSQIPTALAVWNAVSAATGTVTGVSVNGTTYTPNASGVVPLPNLASKIWIDGITYSTASGGITLPVATRSIGYLGVEGGASTTFSYDDTLVMVQGRNITMDLDTSGVPSLTISASVANAFSYSGGVLTIDPTKL